MIVKNKSLCYYGTEKRSESINRLVSVKDDYIIIYEYNKVFRTIVKYNRSRLYGIPKPGDNEDDIFEITRQSISDEFIVITNSGYVNSELSSVVAARSISIFADDGHKIGTIDIQLHPGLHDGFLDYDKRYFYIQNPDYKDAIRKSAKGKKNINIQYSGRKIVHVTKRRVIL
jgi:hypothetical protein